MKLFLELLPFFLWVVAVFSIGTFANSFFDCFYLAVTGSIAMAIVEWNDSRPPSWAVAVRLWWHRRRHGR